ncbi:MAG: efflux RND transporter permease subunit [Rikenellaceae bacterium]
MVENNNIEKINPENKSFLDKIPSFSLILIMVIFTIMGAALIPLVNVSHKPTVNQQGRIAINYTWKGASPRVIEHEVTSKIEGVVSSVKGVKDITSTSSAGSGRIVINLKDGINISSARFEISSLLKQIADKLPDGVSYPYLSGGNVGSENGTSKQLLSYQINADMRQDQIQDYAVQNIQPYLEQVDGVTEVTVTGGVPQYLEISYNPKNLNLYGLTPSNIVTAINGFIGRSNIIGDLEHIDENGDKSRITLHLETSRIGSEIEKTPITKVDDKIIYLGSIAEMTYKDKAVDTYYRVNGMNTVYLNVEVDENANIITMSEKVRAKMESVKENLIDNYYVVLNKDEAEEIKLELEKLIRRTFLSLIILLVFVWIVSRSFRYLSIIAITLVANVLISVILYYLFDVQLHIFSLAGIAVAFGIVIDTSIVMVDHYSYYHNRKVFMAILAALLTTIGSLIIIFFMPDAIREDLADFSAIIIINLTVSLLVSLLFVPAIIEKYNYRSLEVTKSRKSRRRIIRFSRVYTNYIKFTQKRKWIYITILVIAFGIPFHLLPSKIGEKKYWYEEEVEKKWYHNAYNKTIGSPFYQGTLKTPLEYCLGGTLRLFGTVSESFSRSREEKQMVLNIRAQMPEGGTAAQINEKIINIENILNKYDEIERFITNINGRGGSIEVHFTEEAAKSAFPYSLENEVIGAALLVGGVDWSTYGVSEKGFSNSLNLTYKSHRIAISGYNYDKLFTIAEQLCEKMKDNKRVSDVEVQTVENYYYRNAPQSLNEMYIKYDMKKVALYNINLVQTYTALNNIVNTTEIAKTGNIDTDISVVSSDIDKFDVWSLFNSYVDQDDVKIKFSNLGEIGKRKAKNSIVKKNQEYTLNVAFNFLGSYTLADRYVETVTSELNSTLPIGFKCENSSYGWRRDDGSQYWLILVIIVIIFFVCSILFESLIKPLVIISLIPISFIGTFLTFYFSKVYFGTGGFASLVLLSGLVVNAAIYIINEYNNITNETTGRKLSRGVIYMKAYNHKITPVFLTIFSTVLGLIPFLMDGAKEQFWFSFALGSIGGLMFSIIALIFFMPILMPLKQLKTSKNKVN